ncbi:VCBS repeat-containing protein [Marinoscillum pacificum]|uniref:VCBS repeat-containing protein n=1 Tax=Marinoscillum pacificum TaxID=392723 RepID=UPI0021573A1A|nr:VCBS repeat-containing protein [Marinoscillum pacificum]
MRVLKHSYILVAIWLLVSCGAEKQKPAKNTLFQLVESNQSNITFSNDLEYSDNFNIIDYLYFYNGGGLGVGDINNDGLEDLYFSANMGVNKLYLNKGNMTFEDITETAGVASEGSWKTGVTMADVNADGFLDIYLCRVGAYRDVKGKNELYINNGDNTFTEKAADYGLDFSGFSTQAAFFDYDLDGDLDMYLLNHSVHTSRSYGKASLRKDSDELAGDRIYRNDDGVFTDATSSAGIYNSQVGYGLGLAVSDINRDGWPDIYVSNDFHENDYLYINNQDGTFTESIGQMVGHTSRFSMGNDIADINQDGYPEIMTLDMLPDDEEVLKNSAGEDAFEIYKLKLEFGYEPQFARNSLQLNNGDGTFSDVALMYGVAATDWSWSPLIADYDLDGFNDIFITNGIVKRPNDLDYVSFMSGNNITAGNLSNNSKVNDQALIDQMPGGKVVNRVFRNEAAAGFEDETPNWLPDIPAYSTAGIYADLDLDGDLDLVVNNINDQAFVYENTLQQKGNVISVDLKGSTDNPFGIGARINVYSKGSVQVKEMYPVRGFQSSGSYHSLFGLGDAIAADSITVLWPDGNVEGLQNVKSGTKIVFDYTNAVERSSESIEVVSPYFAKVDGFDISFEHQENTFVDFNHQSLIPHVVSREGPKIALSKSGDVYIGGPSGQPGTLFSRKKSQSLAEVLYEETNNVFFDADGDGDDDLLIITGGNEYPDNSPWIADLLYLNESGNYVQANNAIPYLNSHSSVAKPADFDNDGDLDLFIGGRVMSSRYGLIPSSYLLENNGSGQFSVKDNRSLRYMGMVTDAVWEDLDGDGYEDLIAIGEWMPIRVFMNQGGQLAPKEIAALESSNGWWNCIESVDLDGDGDMDFVLGNEGFNNKLKPSVSDPVKMYVNDFDGNGYLDQIITYTKDSSEYPVANRDELAKQMPMIKKSFTNYRDFSGKTVTEVLNKESIAKGLKYQANDFASVVLINEGNFNFKRIELPLMAQVSPIYAIQPVDVNQDQIPDLIVAGNRSWANTYFGSSDGNHGLLLLGKGDGTFDVEAQSKSGFQIQGDVRDIEQITIDGNQYLLFGVNNGSLEIYQYIKKQD